jgi:hypothetical protein
VADIVVFPQTRRAALIVRAATRMRLMHSTDSGDYLIALLELVQEQLPIGHIDQSIIDDQLIALANAIKNAARNNQRRPSGDAA